jgi:hypothetical protein
MRMVKDDQQIGLTIDGSFKDHIICRVREERPPQKSYVHCFSDANERIDYLLDLRHAKACAPFDAPRAGVRNLELVKSSEGQPVVGWPLTESSKIDQ